MRLPRLQNLNRLILNALVQFVFAFLSSAPTEWADRANRGISALRAHPSTRISKGPQTAAYYSEEQTRPARQNLKHHSWSGSFSFDSQIAAYFFFFFYFVVMIFANKSIPRLAASVDVSAR